MKTHEKLAKMRKDAKLSRRELAEISGFNEHTILAYERNQNPASNDYVKFCAFYFGYKIESVRDSAKELEKMSILKQTFIIYQAIEYDELLEADSIEIADDDDPKKWRKVKFSFSPDLRDYTDKELSRIFKNNNINPADYTPSKYAEFIRLENTAKKLEKSKQYSKQDLELLALLNSLDAEVKDNLKALIKSIIAKGGKMWDLHK